MNYPILSNDELRNMGVLSAVASGSMKNCGFCFPEIITASRWAVDELIRLKRIEVLYLDAVNKVYLDGHNS